MAVSYLLMFVSHVVPGLCVGLIFILKSFAEDWSDVLVPVVNHHLALRPLCCVWFFSPVVVRSSPLLFSFCFVFLLLVYF